MRKYFRFIPIVIIAVLIVVFLKSGLTQYLNYVTLKQYHLQLVEYVNMHFALTILIFSLCYIIVVICSIPGATFFTLLGGLLFGSILGTAVVVISATVGATILLIAIKLAFGDFVSKKIGKRVSFMESSFKDNAFFYLLSMRLLPVMPFFIINLAAGIFNMEVMTFFWATLLGIIPGSFVYVNIGANLNNLFNQSGNNFVISSFITPGIIIAFSLLAVLSLLPVIFRKKPSADKM